MIYLTYRCMLHKKSRVDHLTSPVSTIKAQKNVKIGQFLVSFKINFAFNVNFDQIN